MDGCRHARRQPQQRALLDLSRDPELTACFLELSGGCRAHDVEDRTWTAPES